MDICAKPSVQTGKAPKGIKRFDKGRGTKNLPQDEVHFDNGSSWSDNIVENISRRSRMRQAKRDAGIPTSQTNTTHKVVDAAKDGKSGVKRKEYYFDVSEEGGRKVQKTIQDHHNGHRYKNGIIDPRPHWNNHQSKGVKGGTKNHYYYKRKR